MIQGIKIFFPCTLFALDYHLQRITTKIFIVVSNHTETPELYTAYADNSTTSVLKHKVKNATKNLTEHVKDLTVKVEKKSLRLLSPTRNNYGVGILTSPNKCNI